MKLKPVLVLPLLLLTLSACLYAQNWSGILGPTRAIDWSHAGVVGGIPRRRLADLKLPALKGPSVEVPEFAGLVLTIQEPHRVGPKERSALDEGVRLVQIDA